MKGLILFAGLLCIAVFSPVVYAQNNRIQWNNAPVKGFVFSISNDEAQRLLTQPNTAAVASLLHTQVDTFTVSKGWLRRPDKGHFILATLYENKVHCEYVGILPYQVLLLNTYNALSLQVLDLQGSVRADARVKFKRRKIRFDKTSRTYRIDNGGFSASSKFATVELDGFRSIFHLTKHEVPVWEQDYYDRDNGPDFYSYMITDKNKYKPGEHVRFKSYALSGERTPIRRDLEIWLIKSNKMIPLGKISPHRPGSFAGEIDLHDSLHLTLDQRYMLQLRNRQQRVVANCSFRYEDYELQGNKLTVDLETLEQFHPASNQIKINATTENGLRLKDARATVVVLADNIRETFQPLIVLPDTLLRKDIKLDDNGPTLFEIPSVLFQKSNTTYRVLVMVLNSQNQRMEAAASASHYFSQYELTASYSQDSIVYRVLRNGRIMPNVPMKVYRDEAPAGSEVTLPYKEKINPAMAVIRFESAVVSRTFRLADMLPKLEFIGGIQKDSVKISIDNPQKAEISWYIYQGSELLEKGAGTAPDFKSKIEDRTETYYAELFYAFGGAEHFLSRAFTFRESSLDIALDIPDHVYPGQQVEATLSVTNDEGLPVAGVDLTALATTAKLDYYLPDLPYYGDISHKRSQQATYSKNAVNKHVAVLDLDYALWAPKARLDTMKYYQFTYPGAPFFYQQDIADSTQFAVYVMKNGTARQVYVIEVDRKPVYYSWTNQPKGYSFYVEPEKRKHVTLRLYDRVLILDSLCFDAHKKTIISLDLDHLPRSVDVVAIPPRIKTINQRADTAWVFTSTEVSRHTPYLAGFKGTFRASYLETGRIFVPISRGGNAQQELVAGPVAPGMQTYRERGQVETWYKHAGGFSYAFEDNIVYKMPLSNIFPAQLRDVSIQALTSINDRALNKTMLLADAPSYHWRWHPRSIDLTGYSCRAKIMLPYEKAQSGVASVLFQDCKTGAILSPCKSWRSGGDGFEYVTLPRGLFHIMVVYANGAYLRMDSVPLQSYRQVVIDMNTVPVHAADTISREWPANTTGCFNSWPSSEPSRVYSYRYTQTGNVRGRVTDSENQPLPGITVLIKGTTIGTLTDKDGHFAIQVSDDHVPLVFTFIGLKTLEVEVTRGAQVSVIMEADITELQEVVVVAYGTQQKQSLSYSVSSVSADRLPSPDETDDVVTAAPDDKSRTAAVQQLYQELLTLKNIRSSFSDVGFWEPRLYTDRRGQARFTVKFPDDITQWNAVVYAMNRRLQTGTVRKHIQSYKPIMAELHMPQFLTVGDSACLLGKVLNYSTDKTLRGKTRWAGSAKWESSVDVNGYYSEKQCVVPTLVDSLTMRYDFTRDDGYYDGEERRVPVVEQGTIRANGNLQMLANGSEVDLTTGRGEVTHVKLFDTPLELYASDIQDLIDYQYACNEQLASKLIGLLNYRLLQRYRSAPFDYDSDVNKIIQRLLKNQNAEFMWSWWDVSPNTSYWMSAHILRALHAAKEAGYSVALDINNLARKATYKYDFLEQVSLSDVYTLHALATWGAPVDYPQYIRALEHRLREADSVARVREKRRKVTRQSLLHEKLLLLEVRQLRDLPLVRDSLMRYKKETILNEVYFSDGLPAANWYSDGLPTNAIAYRIIKRDSTLKDLRLQMQMYFLAQRRKSNWNTYEASTVLYTILPDLIAQGATQKAPAAATLSGTVAAQITRFPYTLDLTAGQELHIHKDSGLPLYLMRYTEERVTTAQAGTDGFTIHTTFDQKALTAGKPITLETTIVIRRDASAEHVMIEIPIPAGCSYADKHPYDHYVETHREYFKEKTMIFCERMAPGTYVFNVNLLPRFTGTYHINPAQVSLMYFPVINANTDMKKIKIIE